jgi:hypothetical protein
MVATIGLDSDGRIYSTPDEYSYTVYFVDQTTPRWDIPCVSYKCTIVTPEETFKTDMLPDVPLPPGAKPAGGSDAAMLVIDRATMAEYNLRGVQRTDDGWKIKNGSIYNISGWYTAAIWFLGFRIPFHGGLVAVGDFARDTSIMSFFFLHLPSQERMSFRRQKQMATAL